jgi:hypothetical protein
MRYQLEETFFQEDGAEPHATEGILGTLIEHLVGAHVIPLTWTLRRWMVVATRHDLNPLLWGQCAQKDPLQCRVYATLKLQHAVVLHRSGFAFRFFAVFMHRRLIFSRRFLFIDTTCFDLTGHHQVYRLLWWRNLLLTVMLFCFSYVVTSAKF